MNYGLDPSDPAHRDMFTRASGDAELLRYEIRLRLFDTLKAAGEIQPLEYDEKVTGTLHQSDLRREELGLPPIPNVTSREE